jgi:hypothetical protein
MTTKQGHTISVVMLWFYRGGTMLAIFLMGHQFNRMTDEIAKGNDRTEKALLHIAVLETRVDASQLTLIAHDKRFDRLEHPTTTD